MSKPVKDFFRGRVALYKTGGTVGWHVIAPMPLNPIEFPIGAEVSVRVRLLKPRTGRKSR